MDQRIRKKEMRISTYVTSKIHYYQNTCLPINTIYSFSNVYYFLISKLLRVLINYIILYKNKVPMLGISQNKMLNNFIFIFQEKEQ